MRHYAEQGVLCEDDPAAIAAGDRVLIRAHGIPREEEALLRNTGAILVDATCPKVKKAQLAIARASAEGGILLLFGERTHPEVRGLLSYAENPALVFGDLSELEALALDPSTRYFLAAQTTQDRSLYQRAGLRLAEKLGKEVRTLDTICDATRDRQQEVLALCAKVQAMVVVGGFNSGNTRRLAEVARSRGIPAVHVEQISDITPDILDQVLGRARVVGLTAGASTPNEHIDAMQTCLEALPPCAEIIFR
jgi:4-hydroxy-3-methylbut-2-enyl diphosphate reductase